ncbi:hypothetical protein ABT160_43645 [Streptomyces sp. NPDC001941]|uniref:hypothetical protein n=1 Tax=Streptomyces sp. NPDC001941 TaxID=3154659 RepID=UPI0033187B5A
MSTQQYDAEIHVRTRDGRLVTVYHDTVGPAGMSAAQVRADAERAALAQVPGGRVEGSRVTTDGKRR